MANLPISGLTAASTLQGSEPTPIVQGGITKKTTIQEISSYSELGWARYDDNQYTSLNKLNLTNGVQITLPNNANNIVSSPEAYTFYDSATQKVCALGENDCYVLTVVFKASAANTNTTHLDFTMYSPVGAFERIRKVLSFYKANDTEQNFHEVFQYYADANFVSNGVTLKINSEGGTAKIWDIIFFVQRTQRYF